VEQKCTHPAIREAVLEGRKWDGEECLVPHYFPDGSDKPACWCCPDCGARVSYEERVEITIGKPLAGRVCEECGLRATDIAGSVHSKRLLYYCRYHYNLMLKRKREDAIWQKE